MYQYFSLVTFTVNKNGGAEIVLEKLTKEEAELKLYDKMSKTGGNDNVQSIKCILLDTNGGQIKVEELIKTV